MDMDSIFSKSGFQILSHFLLTKILFLPSLLKLSTPFKIIYPLMFKINFSWNSVNFTLCYVSKLGNEVNTIIFKI